jgi:hypothetical protein
VKLRDMATTATMKVCCGNLCLTKAHESGKVDDCINVIEDYMRTYYFMKRHELKKDFRSKLETMTKGTTFGGDRVGQLSIKLPGDRSIDVCPNAFAAVHCRGHTFYDRVSANSLS